MCGEGGPGPSGKKALTILFFFSLLIVLKLFTEGSKVYFKR